MFLHEWPMVNEIATRAKERFPHLKVILGGDNATAYWPWMFEQSVAVDHVVLGEGEATVMELVDRLVTGRSIAGLQGVASRIPENEDGSCDTGLSIRMKRLDVDKVPRPAWDLFPMDAYLDHADTWGVNRGRSIPILGTRGCPYQCTFCSSPQMWTTRYVVRDPESVADEIEHYVNHYGVQNVNFADLTAITKRSWSLDFCDALEAKGLDITWQLPSGTRAEVLDAEVLQRLYDTGCRNLRYAPESGSPRMLEIFDKRVKLETILTSVEEAARIGIVTGCNIIIGHPEETWRDVWKSQVFLVKAALAGANDAIVMTFGPYPGSKDWRTLVDEGKVVVDEAYHYVGLLRSSAAVVSFNPRMSGRQLRLAQMTMMVVFYAVASLRRPRRLLDYLRAWRTGRETTVVDQLLRTKRRSDPSKAPVTPRSAAPAGEPVAA
jgi:radical SAM superfamily enzyme YgiQ (UPF0313 family)